MRVKLIHRKIVIKNGYFFLEADMLKGKRIISKWYTFISEEDAMELIKHPKETQYIEVFEYTLQLPQKYRRIKDGKIIDKMTVYECKVEDEQTGEMLWARDPRQTVYDILNRKYLPIPENPQERMHRLQAELESLGA